MSDPIVSSKFVGDPPFEIFWTQVDGVPYIGLSETEVLAQLPPPEADDDAELDADSDPNPSP